MIRVSTLLKHLKSSTGAATQPYLRIQMRTCSTSCKEKINSFVSARDQSLPFLAKCSASSAS